jgi:O-antigen/teichoic acid export membrane protein
LLFFGKSFSVEGFRFLQIMTLSLIIGTVNYICSAILRIKNKNKEIILASIINASLTLGIGYLLISYGLIGIAVGWITGEIVIAVYYIIIILHSKL